MSEILTDEELKARIHKSLRSCEEFCREHDVSPWENDLVGAIKDYYEQVVIPERERKLIEEIDLIFQAIPDCIDSCGIQCPMSKCEYIQWQQLKQKRDK
jgi:hypothetical protein